jgi:DedD protein
MARPISDEELQLKKRARRRLVGAIVLVTAVAVVLPMVLDSEPRPVSQNVDIQIPSPDSGEFKPKAIAVAPPPGAESAPIKGMPAVPKADQQPASATSSAPEAPKAAAAPATTEAPAKAVSGSEAVDAKDTTKAAAKEPAKTAAAKEPPKEASKAAPKDPPKTAAREKDAANGSGVYVIQVAALADAARVKQLQKQMTAAGLKTYTESIATKTGEITRVRAGPYATREAAEIARTQLKKAGLDGQVVVK